MIFYGLGMTKDYQLEQSLLLRLSNSIHDYVQLEHSGQPHVLPPTVHLDFYGEGVEGVTLN